MNIFPGLHSHDTVWSSFSVHQHNLRQLIGRFIDMWAVTVSIMTSQICLSYLAGGGRLLCVLGLLLLLNSTVGDFSENHNIFVLPPAGQILYLPSTDMLQGVYAVVFSAVGVYPTACSFILQVPSLPTSDQSQGEMLHQANPG